MYEPEPATSRYRQPDCDQDAAVSAEHKRGLAGIQAIFNADRESACVSDNGFLVAEAVGARAQIISVPGR
jgi:hypothetical protein